MPTNLMITAFMITTVPVLILSRSPQTPVLANYKFIQLNQTFTKKGLSDLQVRDEVLNQNRTEQTLLAKEGTVK